MSEINKNEAIQAEGTVTTAEPKQSKIKTFICKALANKWVRRGGKLLGLIGAGYVGYRIGKGKVDSDEDDETEEEETEENDEEQEAE